MKKMIVKGNIHDCMTRILLLLAAVVVLAACSENAEEPEVRVRVNVQPYTRNYTEVEQDVTTRGWVTPDGYYPYDSEEVYGKFINQINLTDKTVNIFFTRNGDDPIHGQFVHSSLDGKWYSTFEITAANYYLYGYIPSMSGVSASISSTGVPNDNTAYSEGAVLKLKGLPAVTANDLCVIVGAKNGMGYVSDEEDYVVTGLQTGRFLYAASAASEEAHGGNYVFLLFDHLYAALRLSFKMDPKYAALRTIRVKRLELLPESNGTPINKRLNMTITLAKTDDGSSPIQSITQEYVEGSGNPDPMFQAVKNDGDEDTPLGVPLSGDNFSDFMGSFVPVGITAFKLTTTYDVYDSQDNLIRENCRATNKLDLTTMFPADRMPFQRGTMYAVQLTVKPTFLYVLSDPDLDNPTIEIE